MYEHVYFLSTTLKVIAKQLYNCNLQIICIFHCEDVDAE